MNMHDKDEIRRRILDEGANSAELPRIKRQVMRICEAVGVNYEDVAAIRFEPGNLQVTLFDRNAAGVFYLHQNGQPAQVTRLFQVDTETFVGDEADV